MSLTRNEWEEMWESIKRIEQMATITLNRLRKIHILAIDTEVVKIKKQIQSVIGQME